MELLVDIAYSTESTTDQQRQLDLYLPPTPPQSLLPPLIVFIHGGAWRAEDKADHKKLAQRLTEATQFPVAVPNYRLTPRDPPPDDDHFRHPGHCEDALQALIFLSQWHGPPGYGPVYNPDKIHLIGHSCSAHMITSIFLDSSAVTPSLTPSSSLLSSVKTITMSEGIYDLDLLVNTFPDYRNWFVAPAFGHRDSFAPFSTTTLSLLSSHIKWLIIHSKNDSLIDVPQSESMYQHLSQLNQDDAPSRVFRNTDQLDQEHDDVLLSFKYIDIVKDFILNNL